jgi:hypothetical protein
MSGVAGADRVKSRQDFQQFLTSYKNLISRFPGFVSLQPSGSYNSNLEKQDFGDIDLIVHITSDKDKAQVKKELQAFLHTQPDTVIVPFSSEKHAGKRSYNAGELVSVRYHDDQLGYSAQIDNIVALDHKEVSFKQKFLDMPAEKQGLVLGLVKIAAIETDPVKLFKELNINVTHPAGPNQEYEFNLSSVKLELRLVTYEPGTFKQVDRKVLWSTQNWESLEKLLYQYDLSQSFDELLARSKQVIKNPRSNQRMQGVFSSMITVKSGEVGTAKGAGKENALNKIQQTFKEQRSLFRTLVESDSRKVVFAFGRFQPPTIGHELLIKAVQTTAERLGADYVIYVSKTQDKKTNPLSIEDKMYFLTTMFPGVHFVACDSVVRTPVEAAKALNQKYNELIMVAGKDRAPTFEKLLNDYNGKEYNYNGPIKMVTLERDPDADDATGMSGTKMRQAAADNDFETFKQGLPTTIGEDDAMKLMNILRASTVKKTKEDHSTMSRAGTGTAVKQPYQKAGYTDDPNWRGFNENSEQSLSVEQLATISDEALDNAYHYGRSTPGNTFGWQANLKSAAFAKQMIDSGVTDIEQISDAIHKGWNTTAQAFVQNPDQFSDTEKLRASGKLDAKLQQRAQLMKQNYAQLPEDEKEKDRVVARALLQAIKGQSDVTEKMMPASNFVGSNKNKLGTAGQWRNKGPKANKPAKQGDFVGGESMAEGSKLDTAEKLKRNLKKNGFDMDAARARIDALKAKQDEWLKNNPEYAPKPEKDLDELILNPFHHEPEEPKKPVPKSSEMRAYFAQQDKKHPKLGPVEKVYHHPSEFEKEKKVDIMKQENRYVPLSEDVELAMANAMLKLLERHLK